MEKKTLGIVGSPFPRFLTFESTRGAFLFRSPDGSIFSFRLMGGYLMKIHPSVFVLYMGMGQNHSRLTIFGGRTIQ